MKPEPTTAPRPAAILAIILVSYFMILLDNSVIFTALPSLQADLQLSTGELSWVQDAYTLVFGGLLLLGARAGDLLGRRRVFVFGLVVFSIASLLIGLAPAGWWAIAGRAVQGIGAAIVAPASLSLLTASFPEGRERTRAVALYGATAGIGASLGLVIGGALAHWISWRAGFFVNVPIGAAMIALAPRFLPETGRARGRFDVFGALSATLGVGALVFGDHQHGRRRLGFPGYGHSRQRRRRAPGRVRADRAQGGPADHAAAAVREPPPHRRLPGPLPVPGRDDRVLLLHHPVPAGSAGL